MATLGFPIYISIILCLTVKIHGVVTLKDAVDKLKDSVDSINVRIDNLEKISNTNNTDSTKKDNAMTEAGDVEQVFVRKSLSVYEGKFNDFQKKMIELMNVINSTIEASHDNCERICADNVANLNSWNKSQENYLNRLEHAVNNATIEREALLFMLQQSIDQAATDASTKLESVAMKIYDSQHTCREEIWDSIGICPIPFDIDRRLSVKYELSSSFHVDVSAGNTIRNQDYAMLNCSNSIEQKYEPSNRRFQCVRGQWMEADRSPDWKLGNNGAFPKCREAKCDPPCQNGGVCFRDGECKCEHMTTGAICETFLCDESCVKNGGECVKPGICGNCPISRHGDNCEIETKCDPLCQNGGVCFRDGECKCEHMTTGAICETFLCDESCAKNGGECVKPGICGNCPISRQGDNCEIETKCDPPCQNGGVCFRDGECKCEHMTTGVICETFLCDESCAKNGGECVKPGICGNCPISRQGDNCEIENIHTSQGYGGKVKYQRTTTGQVSISDVSPDGKYITLENVSIGKNREVVNLDGWKLRSTDGTRKCIYYFRNFKLKPGKSVKIRARANASEAGLNDLVYRDEDTWIVGSQVTTTLLNDKDEEMATHIKNIV